MNQTNTLKRIIALLLILSTIFLLTGCANWKYKAMDIIGVPLYQEEKIRDIIPFYDDIYVITEDGKGYVAGNNTVRGKYGRSLSFDSSRLGTHAPIRFYDGEVKAVFPYASYHALFINSNNELFDFREFDVKKICDDITYAKRVNLSSDMVFDSDPTVFVIDTHNNLYEIGEAGEMIFLLSDIKMVNSHLLNTFVLCTNGDLCEFDRTSRVLSEPLFKNVESFDMCWTALRYEEDGGYKWNIPEAQKLPLINVLTTDGELYTKGAYNLLCCTRPMYAHPDPHIINEWTLLADNVESFALAPMGTIFKFKDNTCAYYGFNTYYSRDYIYECRYVDLDIEDAISVYASDLQIAIKTSTEYYVLGSGFIYDRWSGYNEHYHHIFDENPIKINLK